MFDVISGLFQTHKMMNFNANNVPGGLVRGLVDTLEREGQFFHKMIGFAVGITNFVDS